MPKSCVSREKLFVGKAGFALDMEYEECKDCAWEHKFSGKVSEIPADLQERLGVRDANFYLAALYSVRAVANSKRIAAKVKVTVDGEVSFHVTDLGGTVSFTK